MIHHNGTRYLNTERVAPNVALRLLQRELAGHPCGAGVHTARAFNECLVPTHKVLQLESPHLHIGKFTIDGSSLVCFSMQLESVVLLDYQGPVPRGAPGSTEAVGFHSFFKERWCLPLCNDTEQLCRDFCLSLHRGRFLLLASATPQQAGRQGDTAAAAGAAAAGRGGQQQPPAEQQPQQAALAAADAGVAANHADGFRAPSSDCCDITTFHVVDVRRCVRVDQRVFTRDHFDLSGNACVSLHDNVIALTSIRRQTIHLLQVNSDGTLTDAQQIGPQCQPDDAVPVELAAAAEHRWQLQRQHERQQQQFWMHQQARALLPAIHCPPSAACQCSAQAQQQQQGQPVIQQQQQQLAQQAGVVEQEAAGARGTRRRRGRRRSDDSSSSDPDADRGVQGSDGEASEGRRVRQRLTGPLPPPGQQPQQQLPQPPANPQLQRQQQLSTLQQAAGWPPGAAGDGGAAAAAAATSAALLDPGGQLITGLRQRLLAYLYKAISSTQASEVAPSHRDFQHNFGVLSNLVVWRARLLGRQQLLLKVGAPTSGPAAAADANPNRVHFFSIYDMATTRFTGFWRAGSPLLLSAVLEQPCRFLAASDNLTPLERCCAAALYPVGLPIGLEHTHHHQQQPQQQQQPEESGDPSPAPQQQPDASSSEPRGAAGPAPLAAGRAGVLREPTAAGRSSNMLAAPSAGAGAAAGAAQLSTVGRPGASTSRAGAPGREMTAGDSSGKAARERLKFLRQVVLMVLPGLQNLSPSPYLDPHLFRYSKHISPIIGLRNSPAHAIRFQLAREYPGFYPAVQQQQLGTTAATGPPQSSAAGAGPVQGQPVQQQQQPTQPRRQQQQHVDMFQLDVTVPPTVVHGGEEVVRRQLHLFHPVDPFVLVVVQTAGQPATLNIYCRM